MESIAYTNRSQKSSQRAVAMAVAMVLAVLLSPLYANRGNYIRTSSSHESRWSSGFVLPVVLVGLIVAIKTTSSSSSSSSSSTSSRSSSSSRSRSSGAGNWVFDDASSVLRIGSSSWGLAGVLIMLLLVLSWQYSLQHLFWK